MLAAGGVLVLLAAPVAVVEWGWAQVQAEVGARATVGGTSWSPLQRSMEHVERPGVSIDRVLWDPRTPYALTLVGVTVDASQMQGGDGGEGIRGGQDVALHIEDAQLAWGDAILLTGLSGSFEEGLRSADGGWLGPGRAAGFTMEPPVDWIRGAATVDVDARDGLAVSLSGTFTVDHPRLSTRAVRLPPLQAEMEGTLERLEGQATLGDLVLDVRVEDPVLSLTLASSDARQVLGIVEDIIPELKDAELRGTLGGSASWNRETDAWTLEPHLEGLAVQGAVPNLEQLRWGRFSYRAWDTDGQPIVRASGEGTSDWTSLRDVSEHLPAAIVAAEDSAFYRHKGYDPKAIQAAIVSNQEAGSVVRGGSTLTQQLAKNLFLSGERTLERKLRELLLAVELDRALGKDRVMELYVNVVEWGPEIWGVQQASDIYFARRPATLPPNEAAFLAAILPSPRTFYTEWYLRGRAGSFKMDWVLTNMADGKHFSHQRADGEKARPLRFVPPPK